MSTSMKRFLVDECIFNKMIIQDSNKQSISNGEVAKKALEYEVIIITFDKDFY